jgi:hypothetical protein
LKPYTFLTLTLAAVFFSVASADPPAPQPKPRQWSAYGKDQSRGVVYLWLRSDVRVHGDHTESITIVTVPIAQLDAKYESKNLPPNPDQQRYSFAASMLDADGALPMTIVVRFACDSNYASTDAKSWQPITPNSGWAMIFNQTCPQIPATLWATLPPEPSSNPPGAPVVQQQQQPTYERQEYQGAGNGLMRSGACDNAKDDATSHSQPLHRNYGQCQCGNAIENVNAHTQTHGIGIGISGGIGFSCTVDVTWDEKE